MTYEIPLSQPDLSGNEEKYAAEAIRSSWISSQGPYLSLFESVWAEICGTSFALGTCNGTAALHLALLALDVRPGDEVLVPSLSYVAVANACRYVGAKPVFVDVHPTTWCIDPRRLEAAVTPRTRGIIAVHLYGMPADMDAINAMAAIHGLWVVEDAAEAHFARYKDRPVGGLGRIGIFSFYGNKIITCGEGGAVTTSDPQLAVRLKTLRGQGVDPSRRYFFPVVGYNFRMTNVAAAILCAQLEHASQMLANRRRVYARYRSNLNQTPADCFQEEGAVPWLFCYKGKWCTRQLEASSIEHRPFFIPLHTLPPYREEAPTGELHCTRTLANDWINLPTFSGMTMEQVDRVCDVIMSAERS